MHLCLFEDDRVHHLRPLVETRAAFDLRLGIRSILETTCDAFDVDPSDVTLHTRREVAAVTKREHPHVAVPQLGDSTPSTGNDLLFVNARFIADGEVLTVLKEAIRLRDRACAFTAGDVVVAAWMPGASLSDEVFGRDDLTPHLADLPTEALKNAQMVEHVWDLLGTIQPAIERDFDALLPYNILEDIHNRTEADVHPSVIATAPENIFIAPGATVKAGAILDGSNGPIYLDNDSIVYEQAVVKGPLYLGAKSQIKVQADVAASAIGYWCKVGGEVHDSILHSLSNKGHQGFLGHSYLGRWCNLGADTNTSNLKNDYGSVSAYDAALGGFVDTGRQFAGLFMGDHSKCGINTMFNTGTVVGTGCNIFGGGFPSRYVPPFSWGGADRGFAPYRIDKALKVADTVMRRRETHLDEAEETLLRTLHRDTADER
ncbi:hypothetical protein CRI94_05980 [Longibacter salinarum]|uniref:Glucose-1-phosphate thymidylyltransferase n=1 Tax=Longibacter salinarum TaxID=1850348 RepID=A0A2A8D0T2_9BACT|nr:GlmU family protein [Longibacter salinarum]PEN14572.1 hypothetical protein CRI94_05980 [Longibacter salinarum]